jgi:hypothetical protein
MSEECHLYVNIVILKWQSLVSMMFQQSGEEMMTRRVRRLLATDLAADDEKAYGNNRTLLYAPTITLTIGQKRY